MRTRVKLRPPGPLLAAGLLAAGLLAQVATRAQAPVFAVDTSYADADFLPDFSAASATPIEYRAKVEAAGTLLLRSRDPYLRAAAADTLAAALARAVVLPGADSVLADLPQVSRIADPSGAWRLYTWQHFLDDSTYVYGGLLDTVGGPPIALSDSAQALGLERDYELLPGQWYGAVYYGVRPFATAAGRPAWLLLGYDADGFYHRRKVADVLTFDRRDRPRFGAEVFRGVEGRPDYTFSRLILEYRVDARVGLRYDEDLGGIVHDRLVAGPPIVPGGPPSAIPDGSYDGYVFEDGEWRYREEWFDRVISPEPPRPAPIFGGASDGGRDLFGRARRPE